jgi:hypothetical protein
MRKARQVSRSKDFVGTTLVSVADCARAPFHKKEGGFTIGGPFIKDRLFWFGSFENTRQALPVTITPPSGPVTVQQPTHELLASAKLDWVANSKNVFSARYNVQRDRQSNVIVQTGNNITPDFLVNIISNDEVLNIGLVSTITPHLVNEARFTRHQFVSATPDDTTVPGQAHNSFYTGADFCCPQGANQKRYQYIDNLIWTKGSHTWGTLLWNRQRNQPAAQCAAGWHNCGHQCLLEWRKPGSRSQRSCNVRMSADYVLGAHWSEHCRCIRQL